MEPPDEIKDTVYAVARFLIIANNCEVVLGLTGNITACIVIIFSKSFHTLTGYYLLSLSLADLIILITGSWLAKKIYKIEFVMEHEKIIDPIDKWIHQTALIVSALTVTAFTVERYLAICHPFFVQTKPKKSRVKKILIAIWTISALLALLLTTYNIIREAYHEDVKFNHAKLYIAWIWSVFSFFVPMSVITVMYVLIWLKLKKSSNEKEISHRADTKTLIMFVIIGAVFFISWAPYFANNILTTAIMVKFDSPPHDHDTELFLWKNNIATLVVTAIYPLSSVINPIIYSTMSKNFREAFKLGQMERAVTRTVGQGGWDTFARDPSIRRSKNSEISRHFPLSENSVPVLLGLRNTAYQLLSK